MVQFIGGLIILALICVLANVNLLLATYFGFQWNKQPNTLYYFVGSIVLGAMQFFLILLGCTKLYFFVKDKISGFRFIDLIPNPKIDAYSLRFRNLRGKDLVLKNPFRGIFISGAAGSGKSRSIIEPMIKQAIEKKFTGVMYDFKFPALSEHVYTHAQKQPNLKTYFVNFTDLNRSNRINPIDPNLMNNSSVAREYASAIIQNLNPESIKNKDFWVRSAEAVLTGVFWYLKEEEPRYCTLPHAVALILNTKAEDLIRKLCENQCLINNKCVCGALNRHIAKPVRVISWPSVCRGCKVYVCREFRCLSGYVLVCLCRLCVACFKNFRRGDFKK